MRRLRRLRASVPRVLASSHVGSVTLRLSWLSVACACFFACRAAPTTTQGAAPTESLRTALVDTLTTDTVAVLARPTWATIDSQNRFVIVDGSDKNLKVYNPGGKFVQAVGGIGTERGSFLTLGAGGRVGKELFGFDFTNTTISFFNLKGAFVRSILAATADDPKPSSVRAVDDSLFLVAGFPIGHYAQPLIRLIRIDGTSKAAFFNLARFYGSPSADLIQFTHVVADAAHGLVIAGAFGDDSVYAFDLRGALVASGVLTDERGSPIPNYRRVLASNGGRMRRQDGTFVTTGAATLTSLVALDGRSAVAQLVNVDFRTKPRTDANDGGVLVLLAVDTLRHVILPQGRMQVPGRLVGRDQDRHALVLHYLNAAFDSVTIDRIGVAQAPPDHENR